MEKKYNLKKFGNIVSVLSGGVILLTGCGVNVDVQVDIGNANNMANISFDDTLIDNVKADDGVIVTENEIDNISNTEIDDNTVVAVDVKDTLYVESSKYMDSNDDLPFAYAGYNEFNNHLKDLIGEIGTYSYVDTYYDYSLNEGDTLDSIASDLSTTKSELMSINSLESEDLSNIKSLKYYVKEEYINLAGCTDLKDTSLSSGVSIDTILDLNNIPKNNTVIGKDAAILLHVYNGNETSYETNIGCVNVIYNNRIVGDKVVFASGFSGASSNVLVLNNVNDDFKSNIVTYYSFDGNSNYESSVICLNARDIDLVNGIPVAYFRNIDDMIKLSNDTGILLDDDFITETNTVNVSSNQLNCDIDNNLYVTYNNMLIENNESCLSRSYHADTTGKYVYLDTFASYPVNNSDSIIKICDKFNMSLDTFAQFNPGVTSVKEGDDINYPIKVEFYVASEGENINSIASLNGIDVKNIKSYSSDGIHVDNSGLICLHVFYNGNTNYDTNIGVSNVIKNNKIFGDEFVYASGYAGASNDLLVLNNEKFVSGTNQVNYYSFDGNDNYAKSFICSNASGIGTIDGIPVAYVRNDEDICEIASSMGLTVDDSLYMQLSTSYNNDVIVGTDLQGRKFVTYDEKLLFSDKVTIESNVKTR